MSRMQSLPESVWRWTGRNPGPHVMILGGIHGNEVTGSMLVEELRRDLDTGIFALSAGTLILALGNPRAIASNARGSESHADLNRAFTDARLADAADVSYETQRARELAPLLASTDYLIDLHATNKPSEAFLVLTTDTPKHRELCRLFACEKILHVPETIISGTTIGLVDRHRGTGVCFESGWVGDLSCVGEMRRSVEAILCHAGLIAHAGTPRQPTTLRPHQRLFVLTNAITLTDAGFTFTEGRSQRSFEPFAADDLLGHHGAAPVTAPYDGILMFPKVPELWKVGDPVGFLARESIL
ncbi:MAG: succinylglutamate desuccinylase/aspartoacylase family protein [Polyangiaceae bacterium]